MKEQDGFLRKDENLFILLPILNNLFFEKKFLTPLETKEYQIEVRNHSSSKQPEENLKHGSGSKSVF